MGIAGFAMLASVFFFVKSIIALVNFLVWHKKEVITGVVGEELRSEPVRKTVKHYYRFTLENVPNAEPLEYASVESSSSPGINPGTKVEVYYDSEKKQYREKAAILSELKTNPIIFVVSVVIVVVCILIVMAINKK